MPDQRPYVSQVREEQARRTRRAVVTAARELFLTQGYAATTIDAIAEAAQVSRRTVFNAAGSKVTLLKLALEWAIVGDDEPVALADRPAVQAIQAERDPRRALDRWAEMVTEIAGRVAPIGRVLYAAADSDPEAAELLAAEAGTRMHGATEFTRHLAGLGGLADGVSPPQAASLCWAMMDGHLYHLLVIQQSWTPAAFARWLADSLAATLLA
jgi:AcrR family transcriptional regulator